MTHPIEVFIPMTADQKAEFKSISDREKALADERADFVKRACMEHPDVKVAARLAHYRHKPRAEIVSNGQFKVTFAFQTADAAKSSTATAVPTRAPEYMDPKTMNSLLASKLLTDDEKRRMLAAVFPRTMELVKEPDAAAAAPQLLEALEELVAVSRRAVRLSKEREDFRLHAMEPMLLAIAAAIAAIAGAKGGA